MIEVRRPGGKPAGPSPIQMPVNESPRPRNKITFAQTNLLSMMQMEPEKRFAKIRFNVFWSLRRIRIFGHNSAGYALKFE
jgi:hypothetical protein